MSQNSVGAGGPSAAVLPGSVCPGDQIFNSQQPACPAVLVIVPPAHVPPTAVLDRHASANRSIALWVGPYMLVAESQPNTVVPAMCTCVGQAVPRQQRIMGVEFSYQPPPRNVVPYAAALKSHVTR